MIAGSGRSSTRFTAFAKCLLDLLVDDFHFIYMFIVLQGGVGVAIKAFIV